MKILDYPQESTLSVEKSLSESLINFGACTLFGSIFLALMAQVSINLPFTPVPISMQSLAVFLLVLAQGKNKATGSVVLYLAQATIGLPVLAGGIANPLWIMFPTAGYLVGFVGCAWVAGYLLEKKENSGFFWCLTSLVAGTLVLYLLGTAHLSLFVGWDNAFQLGVLPFLSGSVIKLLAAASAKKPISWTTNQLKIWVQKFN